MWSLGVVALELFTTWTPSHGINLDTLSNAMKQARSEYPLLEGLLFKNPQERWSSQRCLHWLCGFTSLGSKIPGLVSDPSEYLNIVRGNFAEPYPGRSTLPDTLSPGGLPGLDSPAPTSFHRPHDKNTLLDTSSSRELPELNSSAPTPSGESFEAMDSPYNEGCPININTR